MDKETSQKTGDRHVTLAPTAHEPDTEECHSPVIAETGVLPFTNSVLVLVITYGTRQLKCLLCWPPVALLVTLLDLILKKPGKLFL